jgi:hypothetical protein
MKSSDLFAKEPAEADSPVPPRKPAQRGRTSGWQMPPEESPADRYDRLLRAHHYCQRCAGRSLFLWVDVIAFSLVCLALGWALGSHL